MDIIVVMKKIGERTTGDRIALLMRERGRKQYELAQHLNKSASAGLDAALQSLAELALDDFEDDDPAPAIQAELEQVRANLVKLTKAMAKADDEYVMGDMEEERYRPLVASLRNRIDAAKRQAQELEQQLEQERSRGSRRQRAEEVIARGQDVLAAGGKDANVWLRNHLRVWVRDNRISWVELL